MIKKLSDENHKIKITMEEMKKSHAKAIELKICEMKNLQEQNDHQKEKMVEMEAQIAKVNSSLNEKLEIKDNAKTTRNFVCDKCGVNTSSLTILVKLKTNEHNPVLSCDHGDFKSFKITDLQIHLRFKH